MCIREVRDVDIIPEARAVGGRIVGTEDLHVRIGAERGSEDVRDQMRLGLVVLAEAATGARLTPCPTSLKPRRLLPSALNGASCPDGGIGRRTSFRCWRSQGRGGSSPLLGTIPSLNEPSFGWGHLVSPLIPYKV